MTKTTHKAKAKPWVQDGKRVLITTAQVTADTIVTATRDIFPGTSFHDIEIVCRPNCKGGPILRGIDHDRIRIDENWMIFRQPPLTIAYLLDQMRRRGLPRDTTILRTDISTANDNHIVTRSK